MDTKLKSDSYWKSKLSKEVYEVCRQKATEAPFSGKLLDNKLNGKYLCNCCGNLLFDSSSKYDSGSGWPSFFQNISDKNIITIKDSSLGVVRIEVLCSNCEAHLGHVFPDGPPQTGLRYCINSVALKFKENV